MNLNQKKELIRKDIEEFEALIAGKSQEERDKIEQEVKMELFDNHRKMADIA